MDDNPTCRVCHDALREPSVDGVCADCLRTPPSEGASATATTRSFDTPLPSDEALTRSAPHRVPPAPRPRVEVALTEYLRAKHYRDPKKVAAGGYGTVFEATDSVGRRVAVKVLHHYLATELILSRFETEAKALSELDHPGLVKFFHYEPDAEAPLLVTEFVSGGTVAQSVKEGGPLPPREAAGLLAQVAEVVQYLHDQKVLHRDLKPSNILLGADGRPKVADFGLAKRLGEADKQTRSANSVGGTPEYCAPEQFRPGAKTDARSDVYAIGATLYAVLAGHPPFVREPDDDLCQKLIRVIETTPPAPLPADVPADLAAVCLKCLQKHPDDRYQSAAEVAAVLGRIAQGLPVTVRPVREWVARRWRAAKRAPLRTKLTAAVVTLLATAGLAAAVFYQPPPVIVPPPPPPDPNDISPRHVTGGKINLIRPDGWPHYKRKNFGSKDMVLVPTGDPARPHVAAVSADGNYALYLLTESPQADSYRLTVKLRQDETAPGPNKPNARVGVILDYQKRTVIGKKDQHSFTLFGFNDFDPGQVGPKRQAVFDEYTLLEQPLEGITRYPSGGPGVQLEPYAGAARPIRTLELDVTPDGVTARVDGGHGVTHSRADMEKIRYESDQTRLLPDLLRPNPGVALKLPPRSWTPRNPIGVFALGSTLTIHSFEIGPIPPE
ncbi:MAG: serine/threonine-protein kinase [Gemmataceae bacterium]